MANFSLAENKATAPFTLKSTDALALDFANLDEKGLKSFIGEFKKLKKPVKTVNAPNKSKRSNGIAQKTFLLEFEDGQTLEFAVKSDGTIFSVKMNKRVIPVRNTTNMKAAVKELVDNLDKNASAYEKAKALREKRKIKPRDPNKTKPVTTSRRQKIDAARKDYEELLTNIAALQKDEDTSAAELEKQRSKLADLERQLQEERDQTTYLESQIEEVQRQIDALKQGNNAA